MKGLDTAETQEVLEILENLENEEEAVTLLKEFNDKTKALGLLIMNKDSKLSHEEWEQMCTQAKNEVDKVIDKIRSLK